MFPIKYKDVFDLYNRSIDCVWKVDEVDLSKDISDWKKLNNDEQHFIKMVLAFFSSSDGIVCENLSLLSNEVQVSEVKSFYAFQNFMESIYVFWPLPRCKIDYDIPCELCQTKTENPVSQLQHDVTSLNSA